MLSDRLAGAFLFTAGTTILFARAAYRKATGQRPAFAYDVRAAVTILALVMGVIMLTGVEIMDFSY